MILKLELRKYSRYWESGVRAFPRIVHSGIESRDSENLDHVELDHKRRLIVLIDYFMIIFICLFPFCLHFVSRARR